MKKNLVISHKNCLDGFGAAFAAWLKLGDSDTEYVFLDYSDRQEFLHKGEDYFSGRNIYILDFSFKRDDFCLLQRLANRIIWRDHHEKAFKDYLVIPEGAPVPSNSVETTHNVDIYLDNNKSGAVLAWEYFHHTIPPQFIQYIDDRDRWQWRLQGTREFCMALSQLEQNFEVWDHLLHINFVNVLVEKGTAICTYYDTQLERSIQATKQKCNIGGVDGLCCNLPPMFASEAGNELAKQSGTFGATWFQNSTGEIKWSLRAAGNINVSDLAELYSGGGHRNAAGFTSDISLLQEVLNVHNK